MKKFIIIILGIILTGALLYTSGLYISNADNYISVSKVKDNLGESGYNELISYYSAIGYDESEVKKEINYLNDSLQQELNKQTYVEKLNVFIYYHTNITSEDNTNIIKNEIEYINSLSDEEKSDYKNVLEGILSYE